jgi:Flp pilus assembly pilin Flp
MMRNQMVRLWEDDSGALIAAEWVFVATILVLGAITGLVAVRQAVLAELHDFANALLALNQSYSFSGQSNCAPSTGGSQFVDFTDSIVVTSTLAIPGGFDNRACD